MPGFSFALQAVTPYLGALPAAAATTLLLAVCAIVLSIGIGAAGAVARTSHARWLRMLGTAYVEAMRNTPLLVVLYIVFYAAPEIGIRLDSFTSALTALTLNSGAYMTEIFRAGLFAVPAGQAEAARSLGLSGWLRFRLVVFPQVLRIIYAPLGNHMIGVVLGSSLATVVGVNEVTTWMQNSGAASYRFFETFLVAGAVYVVLCQVINLARIQTGAWLFRARG
jgi:His/Glu/Gln/Arg/opine family amino acid ABC transporter permease subunit